jgi:peptide/nickel transport system permease protein
MTRMLPGDMAYRIAAGRYGYDMVTTEAALAVRAELGLDRPWFMALSEWWSRLLHLDLGMSQVTALPVLVEIGHQLGPTLRLSLLAMALSLPSALRRRAGRAAPGGWLDRATLAVSVVLRALPSFLLGLLLVLLFSVQLGPCRQPGMVTMAASCCRP